MRLDTTVTALLFVFFPTLSLSAEITAHQLTLSYSRNDKICEKTADLLSVDKACRPKDVLNCSDKESYSVNIGGAPLKVFGEIATNLYGYTQVYRAIGSSLNGFAIIYVQNFQGDRHPRLVETWKVDLTELDAVLMLPPGPIPYWKWSDIQPKPPKEKNALEFAAMLKRGEKVANEWSPVIDIYDEPYLIERECSGRWVFGGFYACNKVIKLTVKKLVRDKNTVPYCQFVRMKK